MTIRRLAGFLGLALLVVGVSPARAQSDCGYVSVDGQTHWVCSDRPRVRRGIDPTIPLRAVQPQLPNLMQLRIDAARLRALEVENQRRRLELQALQSEPAAPTPSVVPAQEPAVPQSTDPWFVVAGPWGATMKAVAEANAARIPEMLPMVHGLTQEQVLTLYGKPSLPTLTMWIYVLPQGTRCVYFKGPVTYVPTH